MVPRGSGSWNRGGTGEHRHPQRGSVPPVARGTHPRGRCPSLRPTRGGCGSQSPWGPVTGGGHILPGNDDARIGGILGVGGNPQCLYPPNFPPAPTLAQLLPGRKIFHHVMGLQRRRPPDGQDRSVPGCPPTLGWAPAWVAPAPWWWGAQSQGSWRGGPRCGGWWWWRKCPAGSGPAPATKAGSRAAGTPAKAAALQSPPGAPRPCPGPPCVVPHPSLSPGCSLGGAV